MSFFGGMDTNSKEEAWRKKKAYKGKHLDPKVQAAREKLERERLKEEAAEDARIAAENARYRAEIADEDAKEDDDLMDEEAGRMIAVLHQQSADFYKKEQAELALANAEHKQRLKNVKSKIHSYNDKWIKKIDDRHENEAQISALLLEIRERVQNGTAMDDREGTHALEKQLAKKQNWVIAPPTSESPMFKYDAPPTSYLESMLSAITQPTQYWDAQYDASPEAGAQNGWEQKNLVHLQVRAPSTRNAHWPRAHKLAAARHAHISPHDVFCRRTHSLVPQIPSRTRLVARSSSSRGDTRSLALRACRESWAKARCCLLNCMKLSFL